MYAMYSNRGNLRVAKLVAEAQSLPLALTDAQFASVVSKHIAWIGRRYSEVRDRIVRALIAEQLNRLTGRALTYVDL
jgi:hypothetical protein